MGQYVRSSTSNDSRTVIPTRLTHLKGLRVGAHPALQANHHTHSDKNHLKDNHAHFFKTIYENVKEKNKILILGPSHEKKHFKTYLETHFPSSLAKLATIVTVDHPTENQILSYFNVLEKT